MNRQKKNDDEILKDLKEVHQKIKDEPANLGTDEDLSSPDLAEQIEGSDADVDRESDEASNSQSKSTQIKGSDSDLDKNP